MAILADSQDIFKLTPGINPLYKLQLKDSKWLEMTSAAVMPGACTTGWRRSGIHYDDKASSKYVAKGRIGMMCNDKNYIRTANDFIGFGAQEATQRSVVQVQRATPVILGALWARFGLRRDQYLMRLCGDINVTASTSENLVAQ